MTALPMPCVGAVQHADAGIMAEETEAFPELGRQFGQGIETGRDEIDHHRLGAGTKGRLGMFTHPRWPVRDINDVNGRPACFFLYPSRRSQVCPDPAFNAAQGGVPHDLVVLDQVDAAPAGFIKQVGAHLRGVAEARLDHVQDERPIRDPRQAAQACDALSWTGEFMHRVADKLQIDEPDADRGRYVIAGQPDQEHRQAAAEVLQRKSDAQESGGRFASRHGIASDHPSLMVFDHCPGNPGQWQPCAHRLAGREVASPPQAHPGRSRRRQGRWQGHSCLRPAIPSDRTADRSMAAKPPPPSGSAITGPSCLQETQAWPLRPLR